ncbi:hypothetical protein PPYR_14272 [Photinus pyralis]|uniref:Protein MMS22-like n=4 Tax=Photinus pyralis TaxID=7054 RepID=A0A5N4A4R6_PHOPY|nr:hypothetical protein PPYR_14272 [Photinus pyralis]
MYDRRCSEAKNVNSPLDEISDELEVLFGHETPCIASNYEDLFDRTYQSNLVLLEADVLFNKLLRHWVQLEETVLEDSHWPNLNFREISRQICRTLELLRYSFGAFYREDRQSAVDGVLKYTKLLGVAVRRWSSMNERLLNKIVSNAVLDESLPNYHYFHTYLDMQWLILTLEHFSGEGVRNFHTLINDLITVAARVGCAFICSCTKRLWLLLQYYAERSQRFVFWQSFNDALRDHDEVFVLRLLSDVSVLQGYDDNARYVGPGHARVRENYALIERTLKSLNSKCNASATHNGLLLDCCSTIYPLLSSWWTDVVKSEPYQILWEIFYKHINLAFTEPAVESASELVDVVGHISPSSTDSYEYFLFMLKAYLSEHPGQWQRIRGRIYSKLPNSKVKELTSVGLYKIALLFLALANGENLPEIAEKLMALLQNLPPDSLTIHIQIALAILHARAGMSVRPVCLPLVASVEQIVEAREKFNVIRAYVDGFDGVFKAGGDYSLQQHVMISKWVQRYLTACSFTDLCYFLNILSCNVKVLRNDYHWTEWEPVLKQHVLPALKSIATSSNCPSQVGTVAALIDSNLSSDYVLIFTSDLIAVNVTCQYMITLLSDIPEYHCGLSKNHETAILHAWTRCCLLNCEGIAALSQYVTKIGALREAFDLTINPRNPLCSCISSLSRCTSKLVNQREICEQCFGRLDSWILPLLASPTSEPATVHIYTCISLLFFQCAQFLYHKNRSSCLLNRLVTFFLLSTNILIGKKPHAYVLSAIQRTWHLFMQGIFCLDGSNDAYIERTLRDLVARYLPLLSTDDSPILKCLGNERLAAFIFERISASFLSHTSRSSEMNTLRALKLVQLALERGGATDLILQAALPAILEVLIFNNNKGTAIEIVKHVALPEQSEGQQLRSAFIAVTEKHLAFNTNQYFQFANSLAKVIPNVMPKLLPGIRKQVVEVERMRGVGYDNTLRQGLERLEALLK